MRSQGVVKSVRAFWGAVVVLLACDPGPPAPTLDLPDRPVDAPGGDEVARELRGLGLEAWEERIHAEVARGNVPTWLRQLERVELTGEVEGRTHRVTFWVTPDYLAIGSDSDFLLAPLSPRTAQRVADLVGGSLPTPRMVDATWASARVRLVPIRFQPNERIRTVEYFQRHNRVVWAQRRQYGVRPGVFVAGHKLDVVRSAADPGEPGEVALYGWHGADGSPIQPLFPVLMDRPPHFSLGVRLVDRNVLVDGNPRDLLDVLRDPELAPLLIEPSP
jgi:hypothetical protein